MARAWFRPKTYGYGVTPATWEGWAATAAFVALAVGCRFGATTLIADPVRAELAFIVGLLALLAGFLWLSRVKGEGDWRWRWGKDT